MKYKTLIGAVAVIATMAACSLISGSDKPEPSAASSTSAPAPKPTTDTPPPSPESSSPAPTTEPTTAPPDTDDIGSWITGDTPLAQFPTGSSESVPVEVRVGSHEGYERLVVEYAPASTHLTWQASWTDTPTSDGKGDAIPMEGKRFLQIDVLGVYGMPGEHAPNAFGDVDVRAVQAIKSANVQFPFEGQHSVFIGLDHDTPYRVYWMQNPTRLVVDFKTH